MKCWNNLPFNVVSSRSVIAFKKQLSDLKLGCRNDVLIVKSNFLQFATGYYGRLLNQIRYNLNPLRFHLFTYNIIYNPMCPGCHGSVESTEHFFLIVCVIANVAVL